MTVFDPPRTVACGALGLCPLGPATPALRCPWDKALTAITSEFARERGPV